MAAELCPGIIFPSPYPQGYGDTPLLPRACPPIRGRSREHARARPGWQCRLVATAVYRPPQAPQASHRRPGGVHRRSRTSAPVTGRLRPSLAPRSPRRLQGASVPARPSAPASEPSPAPQHGRRRAPRQSPDAAAAPAEHTPHPSHPSLPSRAPHPSSPSSESASEVVRWAAFSCLLVPVVLVVYGTSVGGAAAAALGLAAVTAACRVLLRQSERTAARARAAESAPPRGRRARIAPGADRGGRQGTGSAPGD